MGDSTTPAFCKTGDKLREIRERSQKRKQLLAQALGVTGPEGLKDALKSRTDDLPKKETPNKTDEKACESISKEKEIEKKNNNQHESTDDKSKKDQNRGDLEDEFGSEEIYRDSRTFLKGTQSANPHNDYCQHFIDTGERPQNFIRDVGLANRFEEYPKLRELIRQKDELIATTNTPPMYLKCDMDMFNLSDLKSKFDVILIEPPLEEYQRTNGVHFDRCFSWDEIEMLDIQMIAAQRSFLWIWCGNADGLDRGRQCLKKWGFRRCEDIVWIKTNINNPGHNKNLESNAVLQRTKEHCLMGIRGTVKRSTDGDFIHANVDIDLIIDEETEYGSKEHPIEIFHIIEHFCLGRRRLHIYARDSTIRPGWLSVGSELTSSNFDKDLYRSFFEKDELGMVTGCSEEIERLRPKSPTPSDRGRGGSRGRGGRGRGGNHDSANSGASGRGGSRGGPRGGSNRGRGMNDRDR